MNNQHLYVVILAGGQGTRLWPLSRTNRPKQLLAYHDNKSLLQMTLERIAPLVPLERRWIVTTEEFTQMTQDAVGNLVGHILTEPVLRNTAPALLLTCLEIQKKDPHAEIIFLPADQYIEDAHTFVAALQEAADYAQKNGVIALLGLQPTFAATGYGYIEYKKSKGPLHPIKKFHEKPSQDVAQQYLQQPTMLWNIGVFCGTVGLFISQYQQLAPEVYSGMQKYLNGTGGYETLPEISVDYALMEKSKNIAVLPVNFSWSDIGNLVTFLEHYKQKTPIKTVSLNSTNNALYTKKLITLIDIHDLCIVETDDALLIAPQKSIEKVKELRAEVKKKYPEYI